MTSAKTFACGKAPGLPASVLISHTPSRTLSHSSKTSETCIFQNSTLSRTGFSTYWPRLRAQEQESSVAICSTSSTATACDQTEQMLWTKEVTLLFHVFSTMCSHFKSRDLQFLVILDIPSTSLQKVPFKNQTLG